MKTREYKIKGTEKTLPAIDLYQSPHFDRNEDIPMKDTDQDRCICCNKPLNREGKFWLHMNTSWMVLPAKAEPISEDEDQGAFAIGNACAKRIPKDYKFKTK